MDKTITSNGSAFRPGKMCKVSKCDRQAKAKGYCGCHYQRLRSGKPMKDPYNSSFQVGARKITKLGYVVVKTRERRKLIGGPMWRLEHQVFMERKIGRSLKKHENVHHLNGNRADNRIENLELWSTAQPKGQRVIDKVKWAEGF